MWCKYQRESLPKLCVAYNNIFRKLTHQARDCSANQMFFSRQLSTCKMLIRRNVFGFMLKVQKSNNSTLLNNTPDIDYLFSSSFSFHKTSLFFCHLAVIVYLDSAFDDLQQN